MVDDVQLFQISDLVEPYKSKLLKEEKKHESSANDDMKMKKVKTYTSQQLKSGLCVGTKIKCTEFCLNLGYRNRCFRKWCTNSKARVLIEKRNEIQNELSITHMIRRLRTTEGLLREKLSIDNRNWELAM